MPASYPTPLELRQAIVDRVYAGGGKALYATVLHRATWDGEGFDIVADCVVVWRRPGLPDDRAYVAHTGSTVRLGRDGVLRVALGSGDYDMDLAEAAAVAEDYRRGGTWSLDKLTPSEGRLAWS